MKNSIKNSLFSRAKILAKIRAFFAKRQVSEVETPLLLPFTNPAPYLENFSCDDLYLQTSPEFAMKKLLASGSGDIYQICKAFRKNESGRLHNPEFTILEWYRLNFDHHQLMDEVEELLIATIKSPRAQRITYQEVWQKFIGINPHTTTIRQLKGIAKENNLLIKNLENNCDELIQLLFTHIIEPQIGKKCPVFIYDFPASQAMLARIRKEKYKIASRFELYYQGIELANGFHELKDPREQHQRFKKDSATRQRLHLPNIPIDHELLKILPNLPDCAGVALGVDRLLLLATKQTSLDDVVFFRS